MQSVYRQTNVCNIYKTQIKLSKTKRVKIYKVNLIFTTDALSSIPNVFEKNEIRKKMKTALNVNKETTLKIVVKCKHKHIY